jgi:hypothetical protein
MQVLSEVVRRFDRREGKKREAAAEAAAVTGLAASPSKSVAKAHG